MKDSLFVLNTQVRDDELGRGYAKSSGNVKMANTLYELLADGREYVVAVLPVTEKPGNTPPYASVIITHAMKVHLLDKDTAEVGEPIHASAISLVAGMGDVYKFASGKTFERSGDGWVRTA